MIVDREPAGLDVPGVCRALRADPQLEEAWLLALTIAAHKRTADAALDAGADDYCTARSPAPSCSRAPAPAFEPPSSAPTTRSCGR